jgi:hypothetical protein
LTCFSSGCLRRYRTAFLRRVLGVVDAVGAGEDAFRVRGVVGGGVVGQKEVLTWCFGILRRVQCSQQLV